MAQANCPICAGTGWKTVDHAPDKDKLPRGTKDKPAANAAAQKTTWAVPCDCTGTDRTARILARARIPTRYEHCDVYNFDKGLYDAT